ncbi:MAG: hypothetical protein NTY71_04105 [Methanoregula sp.]|nr:hypothetical protein [Methanoregula sp.]
MDYQAIKQEITGKKILFAAVLGIIMGLTLQAVIVIFGRWRYMPVLFVLVALIFILAEILWINW